MEQLLRYIVLLNLLLRQQAEQAEHSFLLKKSRVSNHVKYLLVKCFWNILAVVYFDFYAFISSFPLFVFTVLETLWFGVISTNPLLFTFVFITFLTFSYVIRIGDLKMNKKNGTLHMIIHLSYQRNQIVLKFWYLAYIHQLYIKLGLSCPQIPTI